MPVSFPVSATMAARRSSAQRNSCSIPSVSITGLFMSHRASLKVVGEDPRLIVLFIVRSVEQSRSPGLKEIVHPAERVRVGAQFNTVAPGEFGEAGRVVAEPSP